MRIGLDIGSTTIKVVVFDEAGEIVFRHYERHCARINELCRQLLGEAGDAGLCPRQRAWPGCPLL